MRLNLLILISLLVLILGSVAFFLIWEIPAPTTNIEKILPDERFPK